MTEEYGKLLKAARAAHDPPMNAKKLADLLLVKPSFITDIEKGRRLPSLDTQIKIKNLLACDRFPDFLFDDLAAASNSDSRIVAEDLSQALRKKEELRDLVRTITKLQLTSQEIKSLTAKIGGPSDDIERTF